MSEIDKKTETMFLYIAKELCTYKSYGSTLLNKALYFSDNAHYLNHGKPISSFKYVKQVNGPTLEPKVFMSLRQELLDSRKIEIIEQDYFGRIQKRITPLKEVDIDDCFTAEELRTIDSIIENIKDVNATAISDFSHQEIAWKVARDFEELPFYTYLLTQGEITEEDVRWSEGVIAEHRVMRNN